MVNTDKFRDDSLQRNPLEVLGISRDLVSRLPQEQLPEVIKAVYRGLSLVLHPDKGGDSALSAQINSAFERLRAPEAIQRYRTEYVKHTHNFQSEIDQLARQLTRERSEKTALLGRIVEPATTDAAQSLLRLTPCRVELLVNNPTFASSFHRFSDNMLGLHELIQAQFKEAELPPLPLVDCKRGTRAALTFFDAMLSAFERAIRSRPSFPVHRRKFDPADGESSIDTNDDELSALRASEKLIRAIPVEVYRKLIEEHRLWLRWIEAHCVVSVDLNRNGEVVPRSGSGERARTAVGGISELPEQQVRGEQTQEFLIYSGLGSVPPLKYSTRLSDRVAELIDLESKVGRSGAAACLTTLLYDAACANRGAAFAEMKTLMNFGGLFTPCALIDFTRIYSSRFSVRVEPGDLLLSTTSGPEGVKFYCEGRIMSIEPVRRRVRQSRKDA